jgi:hypothetical protein
MISNTLANATFSDPKDYSLESVPVTVESMPFDCVPLPAVSCCVDPWQHVLNERKRTIIEIEPTPIGPRTSVNVVDAIPVENSISFDQCEDILVETFLLPMDRHSCNSGFGMTKIEFEPSNKRRKFATVTPRASFSSTENFAWEEDDDFFVSEECKKLAKPDQWYEKYEELCAFYEKFGHCLVPNKNPERDYQSLSQWVKRQRHQHKIKRLGRHSTLTEDREVALRKLGFVWDSHGATWNERFSELLAFKADRGHCNVPTDFPENPQLSIWVKCQRRQYKLNLTGKKSNINPSRISKLNDINLVWNPRNLKV